MTQGSVCLHLIVWIIDLILWIDSQTSLLEKGQESELLSLVEMVWKIPKGDIKVGALHFAIEQNVFLCSALVLSFMHSL